MGSVLVVPFSRRRVLGVVVDVADSSELPPGRLAEPIEALEAGVPAELVGLGLGRARVLLDAGTRPRARAAGDGRRRAAGAAPTRDVGGGDRRRARGARGDARLGPRQRAVLEAPRREKRFGWPGVAASELAATCGRIGER